jgi:hypothetical protein
MNLIRILAGGDPAKYRYLRERATFDEMAELVLQGALR